MGCFTANVPENMSYVNAFYALWQGAKPVGLFGAVFTQKQEKEKDDVSSSEKIETIFQKNCPNLYVNYVGGKFLRVSFQHFPKLDVRGYEVLYGEGSAEKALSSYARVHSESRLDRGDRCSFEECRQG